jgi:hypothetical protein
MANEIKRLLDSDSLRERLAVAALERAGSLYTPDAQCRSCVSIYEELLRDRSSL